MTILTFFWFKILLYIGHYDIAIRDEENRVVN